MTTTRYVNAYCYIYKNNNNQPPLQKISYLGSKFPFRTGVGGVNQGTNHPNPNVYNSGSFLGACPAPIGTIIGLCPIEVIETVHVMVAGYQEGGVILPSVGGSAGVSIAGLFMTDDKGTCVYAGKPQYGLVAPGSSAARPGYPWYAGTSTVIFNALTPVLTVVKNQLDWTVQLLISY